MADATDDEGAGGPAPGAPPGLPPRRAGRLMLALAAAGLLLGTAWMVRTLNQPRSLARRSREVGLLTYDRPFPPAGRFPSDPYVGSAACSECHPGEAALHARSGHSSTLRPAGRTPLARELDGRTTADPELAGVSWSYRFIDGALHITRREQGRAEECVADYAFGSGHRATTFVSMIDPAVPAILEHRLTAYARSGTLGLTPGHDIKPPPPGLTPLGGVPPPRATRSCFGCHATQIAPRGGTGIDQKSMIPNVACERCHGPGRAHVEAARRKAPDSELLMPFGQSRWKSDELLKFCGDCHRHPSGPRPEQIRRGDPLLVRFQPIGLAMSECYRKSGGAFTCVSCHDPHGRASADRANYDPVCLKCHEAPARPAGPGKSPAATGSSCPVSPRERCVECHMPRVDLGHELLLSDHWIRVTERDENAARDAAGPQSRATDQRR